MRRVISSLRSENGRSRKRRVALLNPTSSILLHLSVLVSDVQQSVYIFFFFFLIYLFIYLFMAALGLRSCARAFSSCGKRGPLLIAVRGPLTVTASYCGAQAPDAQAQQLWLTGPSAPRHVGSSQTRARTRVPCTGRQTLNHCATREAPYSFSYPFPLWFTTG